jgi:hypothetical protein
MPVVDDYFHVSWQLLIDRWIRSPLIIVVLIVVGVFVWPIIRTISTSGDATRLIIFIGVPLAGIAVSVFMFRQRNIPEFTRLINAGGEVTMEFSDGDIWFKNGMGELRHGWNSYRKAIATKEQYILMFTLAPQTCRFIPRRAFTSPDQETAFRDLLARKLNFKA